MDLINKFFNGGGENIGFVKDGSLYHCWLTVGECFFRGTGNTTEAALTAAISSVQRKVAEPQPHVG